MKERMIDYRDGVNPDGSTHFVRKTIDDFEFCVRDGVVYFISEDKKYHVYISEVSQIYTN